MSTVINIIHHDNLGDYLGCLVFKGIPKVETFIVLTNKIVGKIQTWKAKNVTKAWRVPVIHAYIKSMSAHTIQCS